MKAQRFVARVVVCGFMLVANLSASNGLGAGDKPCKRHCLQITINLDKDSYRLNDAPKLSVRIKNTGSSPVAIYKHLGWGHSSSLSLDISGENGRPLERQFIPDAQHMPPYPPEDFLTIKPGGVVKHEYRISLKGEGIREAGLYKIIVWYHSPVPREFAPPRLKVWAMEDGELQSNAVTFKAS